MSQAARFALRAGLVSMALVVGPAPLSAQQGYTLRGTLSGLPPQGVVVPQPFPVYALVNVLTDRAATSTPVLVVFPAEFFGVRTEDMTLVDNLYRTRVQNGQLRELLVLPEAPIPAVRVLRDVGNLIFTGTITEVRDGAGNPIDALVNETTNCPDPRDCVTIGADGGITVDLGPPTGSAVASFEITEGTFFRALCKPPWMIDVRIEAMLLASSRLVATRVDGLCIRPPF
jgi:hypothetical protein